MKQMYTEMFDAAYAFVCARPTLLRECADQLKLAFTSGQCDSVYDALVYVERTMTPRLPNHVQIRVIDQAGPGLDGFSVVFTIKHKHMSSHLAISECIVLAVAEVFVDDLDDVPVCFLPRTGSTYEEVKAAVKRRWVSEAQAAVDDLNKRIAVQMSRIKYYEEL